MKTQYIGKKKISAVIEEKEKTDEGLTITEVKYEDGTVECLSKIMYDNVVSDKQCDDTELREKRIAPVVKEILVILRKWGVKIGELQYFSAILNQSLDYNQSQAMMKLLSDWMPKPNSLDDISLVTIDRILRDKK